MKLFARRGAVLADVGDGFVAGEAVALQAAFTGALTAAERSSAEPVRVDLTLETEHGGRALVVCRNHVVGFVPPSWDQAVRAQVAAAGRARLATTGQVYRAEEGWRLWVGPPHAGDFPGPEPGADTLRAPQRRILGIALPDA
ncbi:hypothetical protein [Cellulomonas fengjieae]|uniref:HIRAN domain-containing protein n=1 Tax=Cellulomonas fengjieae TaxID=2819978 RepID=A0ABS3SJZ9_9CELL|nr:hypothetical protein [Cellulomonas fengjieae]MBO3086068.1 hypothetical protein [Cellulomonas fengjieae]QVI65865.1 hypothetical protein KG102_17620 [Cellulomonas fengjieae]